MPLFFLIFYEVAHSITYSLTSATPTLTPTTSTPSSNYPSLSPSTVYIISTVAGSSTSGSYSGDGAAATSALLYYPYGVTVDATGKRLYN